MTNIVYHFTDTARLPWILHSDELRSSTNKIGGFPSPDFLWATLDPKGDRTASGQREHYRRGVTRLVRFTLSAQDFEPWREIVRSFPAWTPEHISRIERFGANPALWRCRIEPLRREHWIAIDSRSYAVARWQRIPTNERPLDGPNGSMGVMVDGSAYFTRKFQTLDGGGGFEFIEPDELGLYMRERAGLRLGRNSSDGVAHRDV